MKQKQNIIYTFLIFFCLIAYTHWDYVLAGHKTIEGPLIVAMSICNIALDAAVATFVSCLLKKRWYNAGISIALWLFCMMNVLYLRHFDTYVDITLAGELRNADILGESILALTKWRDIVVSVAYLAAVWLLMWREPLRFTRWIKGYTMIAVAAMAFVSLYGLIAKGTRSSFVDALDFMNERLVSDSYHRGFQMGFTHYVAYDFSRLNIKREITKEDEQIMKSKLAGKKLGTVADNHPRNVVFILMEGILSEAMTKVCDGDTVMPNLLAIADTAQYCNLNMESETNIGWSSDGQLIYMTGILPHSDKNTVNHFTHNAFPGLGTVCKGLGMQTAMLLPTGKHIWRQEDMCMAYGIDSLHATVEVGQDDDDRLVDYAINLLDKVKEKPFFLTVLNISTHTPFTNGFKRSLKDFHEKDLPEDKKTYYEMSNFWDVQLGRFVKALKDKGMWDESLVVIASDHHLGLWMKNNKREKIPFIITGGYRSNLLSERVRSNDAIYQSDFYPTLLALLGVEQKWTGLGRNLFSEASKRLSEADKQQLSDVILETNWFAKIKQ